ncbi:MAG: PDZ domain-containing protein [Dehalococcoidia bacterium]|nr:PDZ domain-containing protein [Dehalococcoidia bacterium]
MFDLPGWLLIVPVLGFLIFIHELGHFATAKWFGIKVTEFGFGFPPRIFGVRYRDTVYSLNWIPLGGFVRMVGEEDPSHPRSFAGQARWKRAIVLVAGSVMNLAFPIAVFAILFTLPHDTVVGTVTISGVSPDSPAQEAGLRPGDQVLEVEGKRVENHFDLIQTVTGRLGRPTEFTIRRGLIVTGLAFSPELAPVDKVTITPRLRPPEHVVVEEVTDPKTEMSLRAAQNVNPDAQVGDRIRQGAIGVLIGTANPKIVQRSFPVWDSVPMAVGRAWDVLTLTQAILTSWARGGPDPGITGPVGIAQVTGEIAEEIPNIGFSPMFEFVALISISLGIVNLLPIPALDGGRLLFVGIEWVRRGKRISPQREGFVHMVGFALLIGLIVAMSYRDIVRIIAGESFIR